MFLGAVSVPVQSVFRIRNWERLVSRGRSGSRSGGPFGRFSAAMLGSVGGMKSLVRRRLLKLPHGLAAYGVWILLVSLAAETSVPGVYIDDDGTPLTLEDLSLLTDVSLDELRDALQVLAGPEVRLIETVSLDDALAAQAEPAEGKLAPHSGNDASIAGNVSPLANLSSTVNSEAGSDDCRALEPECGVNRDADLTDSRRLKVAATETKPDSRRLKVAATEAKPEILTHQPLAESTPTSFESSELDKIGQQMAQLAGVCQQIDQMKTYVAAMTNSTPLLTKGRKGKPNGWKVNATLNPGT